MQGLDFGSTTEFYNMLRSNTVRRSKNLNHHYTLQSINICTSIVDIHGYSRTYWLQINIICISPNMIYLFIFNFSFRHNLYIGDRQKPGGVRQSPTLFEIIQGSFRCTQPKTVCYTHCPESCYGTQGWIPSM